MEKLLAAPGLRGVRPIVSGFRCSNPSRCSMAISPERLSVTSPNSFAIEAPTTFVERGEVSAIQAFGCASRSADRELALPPPSSRRRPSSPSATSVLRQPPTLVAEIRRLRDLLAAPAAVEQQQGVGPPRRALLGMAIAKQRYPFRALARRKKAAANHASSRIRQPSRRNLFFRPLHESGYTVSQDWRVLRGMRLIPGSTGPQVRRRLGRRQETRRLYEES